MKIVVEIDGDKVDKDELAFLVTDIKEIMGYSFVESIYIDINGKEMTLYDN